jgi:hypothetical protein
VSKNFITHGIMEIGVNRNGDGSFTQALLSNKPDQIKYLGVDLDDKSYLNDTNKNIYTIKANSYDQRAVRDYLNVIGIDKLSILFIDGDHSVNTVINDWLYSDLLSDNGIVMFHDTSGHPGPTILVEYIDANIYRVEKHFENQDDYGLAIAYKL